MSRQLRSPASRRSPVRLLIGLVAAAGLLFPQGAAHAAPYRAPGDDKIAKAVATDLKDGKATFFVRLAGEANVSAARRAATKQAKGRAVYAAKTAHANRSQARLRKLLTERKAAFTPFWIANIVKVTADPGLATEIAALPEVTAIEPIEKADPPKPRPGKARAKIDAAEWNIDRIGAPQVWTDLKNLGEGVVVGIMDSGVDIEHPDLAGQYRGTRADGYMDHDYNWTAPEGMCPSAAPCDPHYHGTHVTGTIVGKSGIGVAPGAKWIAAGGCCDESALLAGGQWMLAPTDVNGQNPRPDLAPDIINNSWGGKGYKDTYETMVSAWVDAGIFPMFAIGNDGPACGTAHSPGMFTESYASGAFGADNAAASFSSRGAGENGELKPNISAPGDGIRSSIPEGGYKTISGTSMASPHVAATVVLMLSAAPSLRGDVAAVRALLDSTAIDGDDTTCGGTSQDNNIYGEGRLDAYAAVQAAPDDPLGTLSGTVTSTIGVPVTEADVTVTGPLGRTAASGGQGAYSVRRLPPGTYQVTASRFGYSPTTTSVTIVAGQTTTADLALTLRPHAPVSGTISVAGVPEKGATVKVAGTTAEAVTDAAGHYQLGLPHGSYRLEVSASSRCVGTASEQITVAGSVTKNVDLQVRHDTFGYTCTSGTEPYVAGTQRLTQIDTKQVEELTLPFPVPLYGTARSDLWVSARGFASFIEPDVPDNEPLPNPGLPNLAVYPFWENIWVDAQAGVYTATVGTAPHRSFVIEWRNVTFNDGNDRRLSFSVLLGEDGTIGYRYKDIDAWRDQGLSATIGLENQDGSDAFEYSYNARVISEGRSLTFTAPAVPRRTRP
ncbi:peptidase S8 [Spongiactinospora rosea]|uniref:Peptidase S8 n=1 Tax=Spongiactinospora rosea TaxID=2248750 RepID=A0A366LYP9_9ACTN|nr:S8 family serine peptidase [Spongiactinospora rosea]RBQ18897.1 peptidase S8 [Spongiactinospora rosea]